MRGRIVMRWGINGVLALVVFMLSRVGQAAPGPFELTDDPSIPDLSRSVVTVYDPTDGFVAVRTNNTYLTSYQIESTSGDFRLNGLDAQFLAGPFDIATEFKLFTLRTDGETALIVGHVLPANMSAAELVAGLTVDGSVSPHGAGVPCGGNCFPYLYIVPAPTSFSLLLFGLIAAPRLTRRRHLR